MLSTGVNGCSDAGPDEGAERVEESVSDPLPLAEAAGGAGSASFTDNAGQSPAEPDYVHVALPPAFAATGQRAVLRNAASQTSVVVTVRNGGFDPVPIAASPGDEIDIQLLRSDGSEVSRFSRVVPPRRPPHIVRTIPHKKRPDVPINHSIIVVFSEPVDATTVSTDNVRLFRGSSPVTGSVQVLPGNGSMIAFTPSSPMNANASYRLEVSRAMLDRQGDPMASPQSVSFTTSAATTGPVDRVIVSPDTVEMVGSTYQLTATVWDGAGNMLIDQPVTWDDYEHTGISVSPTGLLTATAEGNYDIGARVGDVGMNAHIIVRSPHPPAALAITPNPASVAAEDTIMLTVEARDANGMVLSREIVWTSSDPSLATVVRSPEWRDDRNHDAIVVGRSAGTVRVTASTGGLSTSLDITVLPPRPVASVTISPESVGMVPGGTVQLFASVRDGAGRPITARPVTWTSDDPNTATISNFRVITGVSPGATVIRASVDGVSAEAPVTVETISGFASLAAGVWHTCGLDVNGRAFCWGNIPDYTVAFTEPYLDTPAPVAMGGDVRFASITSGNGFTCGLDAAGAAWCWGYNQSDAIWPGSETIAWTPVRVAHGLSFTRLSAGSGHVCGLGVAGTVHCWGSNNVGQLGRDPVQVWSSTEPIEVSGGHAFSSVSAGGGATCGVTTAGTGLCWGWNEFGLLGSGTSQQVSIVPLPIAGAHSWSSISVGIAGGSDNSACGLTTAGVAYCWGANNVGQLGNGQGGPNAPLSRVPVAVGGGHTFTSVDASGLHACGRRVTGETYCWGAGGEGQLGNGTDGTIAVLPVPVTTALAFTSIDLGRDHSCAISTGGQAYCWGSNLFNRLGHGSFPSSNVPSKVAGQP